MHILKLPWFGHKAENKEIECYSVSINSDGTRLASGGLDGNVKIWDTKTVLQFYKISNKKSGSNSSLEPLDLPQRSLRRPMCSMSRHNGVVTSVKFSPDGRFLASGSDDKIILIWEKDEEQSNRPKQFGEVEADLEHWTVRKRLVAHDNDIQDICWSPDGSLLVTVGLDRSIIIWNGATFERIKRYDIHQSMVKGIVFDPANKFFATASDDRTVRIFRYYKKINEASNFEFQMESVVTEPFKKSPLTSYFRRMSWSPDGQHIAVPNATNGPVTSISIINRGNWATDVSLIGHEAPCEVCSFSPRLFKIGDKYKEESENLSTILATGGQDRALAIWSTFNSRPILVAQDIVESSITDICWSPDGETLYFSCLDGSITCVIFEPEELGKVIGEDVNDIQLHRFGADRDSATFPESIEQLILEDKSRSLKPKENKILESLSPSSVTLTSQSETMPESKSQITNIPSMNPLNKLAQSVTITKNGKKRIAPLLVSSSTSSVDSKIAKYTKKKKQSLNSKISHSSYYLPKSGIQTSVNGIRLKEFNNQYLNNEATEEQDNDNEDMGIDENSNVNQSSLSEATIKRQRTKQKRLIMEARYPNSFKIVSDLPETLFNNQAVLSYEINSLLKGPKDSGIDLTTSTSIDVDENLIFSVLVNNVQHSQNRNYDIENAYDNEVTQRLVTSTIEVRNGQNWSANDDDYEYNDKIDFQDPTSVIVSNNMSSTHRKYVLYFPYKIQYAVPIIINQNLVYFVLISFNGTIQIILAESGNYLCPSFEMGDNVVMVKQKNGFFMILTSAGLIFSWQLSTSQSKIKSTLNGVSIAPILNNIEIPCTDPAFKKLHYLVLPGVRNIEINPKDGTPYVVMDNKNDIYSYSKDLNSWIIAVDSWYYSSLEDNFEEIKDNEGSTLDFLVTKTLNNFKNDVKKHKINRYVFSENTKELKEVMKSRFDEMMHPIIENI